MCVMIENIKLLYSKSYYSVEITVNCLKLSTNCNLSVERAMPERTQVGVEKYYADRRERIRRVYMKQNPTSMSERKDCN